MRPTPDIVRDFQRSTAPLAPRPGFDHAGIDIAAGPRPVIGERSYAPPVSTARDHGDDVRAADRPMSLGAWAALLVVVAVVILAVAR